MDLYPAIDLRGGRCVRLSQGDYARETVYSGDPLEVARSFEDSGARWVHVVDLDAARTGEPLNRRQVAAIAAAVNLSVQAGGGVRTIEDAAALLEGGVARVVLGTAAALRPEIVEEASARWPGRVAVAVDHRGGVVQLRGWQEASTVTAGELAARAARAGATVIVTDVQRDGLMEGPEVEVLGTLLRDTPGPLIASGGVSSLGDIEALARLGAGRRTLDGVVVGRAIYEGAVDVASAVELLRRP